MDVSSPLNPLPDEPSAPQAPLAPIFVRLFIVTVLLALFAGGAGYIAFSRGATFAQMSVFMCAVILLGCIPLFRWSFAAMRRAGHPVGNFADLRGPEMRRAWPFMALFAASIVIAIVVAYVVYASTGSRLFEAVVAIVNVPVAFALHRKAYATRVPSKPKTAAMLGLNWQLQLMTTPMFAANLILQLTGRHYDGDHAVPHDALIAGLMVIIPLGPISAYFSKRRADEAAHVGSVKASSPV